MVEGGNGHFYSTIATISDNILRGYPFMVTQQDAAVAVVATSSTEKPISFSFATSASDCLPLVGVMSWKNNVLNIYISVHQLIIPLSLFTGMYKYLTMRVPAMQDLLKQDIL